LGRNCFGEDGINFVRIYRRHCYHFQN
jgi:hypothetical protein